MITALVLVGLFGMALALLALPALGLLRVAITGFLLAAVVVPFPILVWSSDAPNHTGISHTSPSITTYTLTLCLLLLGLVRGWKRNGWLLAYGLAISSYLVIGLLTFWSGAEAQWAGAVHWLFALMALVAGYQFGSQLSPDLYRYVIRVVFILFVLNGVLCVAQLAGLTVSLFPYQLAHHMAYGRPIGTFSHPSTLGKFVLIMLILVLPALRCHDRGSRRLAWWCVGIAVPLVALTLARANLAAVVVAIVLWLCLDRRTWSSNPKRVLLLMAVFIVSAPIVGATLERFSTDPGGGDRGSIYRAGLKQIGANLWGGTGPNYYAEIVGRWDQLTAWGYPLHNSFLYPVAELGIVGGVLFTLPVLVICAIAIVDCLGGRPSPWSKAYLVTFPGIMAITMTGWGMLVGSTLCLWYFAIGVCAGGMLRQDTVDLFTPNVREWSVASQQSPRVGVHNR